MIRAGSLALLALALLGSAAATDVQVRDLRQDFGDELSSGMPNNRRLNVRNAATVSGVQ